MRRHPTWRHSSPERTPGEQRRRTPRTLRTRRRWPWCRPQGEGSSVCWPGWWTSPAGSSLPGLPWPAPDAAKYFQSEKISMQISRGLMTLSSKYIEGSCSPKSEAKLRLGLIDSIHYKVYQFGNESKS